jgi:hypothetical protein
MVAKYRTKCLAVHFVLYLVTIGAPLLHGLAVHFVLYLHVATIVAPPLNGLAVHSSLFSYHCCSSAAKYRTKWTARPLRRGATMVAKYRTKWTARPWRRVPMVAKYRTKWTARPLSRHFVLYLATIGASLLNGLAVFFVLYLATIVEI